MNDEVEEQLRLGLVGGTVARELARLPRGNQEAVLTAVRTHDLGSRDVAKLVDIFNGASEEQRDWLLRHPREALANARADRGKGAGSAGPEPRDPRLTEEMDRLVQQVKRFHGHCEAMNRQLRRQRPLTLTESERPLVLEVLHTVHVSVQLLAATLESTLSRSSDDT